MTPGPADFDGGRALQAPEAPRGFGSRLPVRTKWTVGASLIVAVASLAAFFYFPAQLQRHAGVALAQQGQSIAEIAAFSSASGLFLMDPEGVQDVINGAIRVEGVVYVVVEDTTGQVVAEHGYDRAISVGYRTIPPEVSECPWCTSSGPLSLDVFPISVPVRQGTDVIGTLYLGVSRAPLRAQVAEERIRIGLLCFAVFLVGLGGAFTLSSIVTGPLGRISAVVRRIASGDLSQRAPVESNDEVGQLAIAFNAMIDRVENAQGKLREINESLEERVDERTSELREALERRDRAEASHRLLAGAVQQSAEVLIVMDVDGIVTYVNPAFERIRGIKAEEIVGHNLLESLREELGSRFVEEVIRTAVDKARWLGQLERPRADGTTYLQRTAVSAVRNEDGSVTGIVVIGQDVTREVELEDRLRQSQKMEAVGQLAGGIAHDFNNLLTAIRGHSELLLSDELNDRVKAGLEQISEASDRAASLTRQLLAFSRRQILRPEPLMLDQVLRDMAPILSGLTGKDTMLRVVADASSPRVVVDRSQLEQILIDLVLNAREAIDGAGEITVSVHRVPRLMAPNDWDVDSKDPVIRVTVQDNGRGISPDHQELVFEPFFTTKGVGEGAGLGLSTAYGIIQQSGGAITLHSEVGVGTRIDMYFAEAPALTDDHATNGHPGPDPGLSVLVVDDEPLVRSLVRRYLERDGYEVLEAEDGEAAWDLLNETDGDVGLLLSDVRMPGIDGLTLARKAARAYPVLNILLMSGYSAEIAQEAGSSAFRVLSKPFGRDELLAAVGEATT